MGSGKRRSLLGICTGIVLVNTAMVGASAASTLVATDVVGPTWSAIPNASGVLGTALGALGLASVMAGRGRRVGLLLAYSVGATGGAVASFGVLDGVLPMLVTGMLLLGIGNAGAQLARYAAADLFPREQRGFIVGAMVWGGTVGAVVGPTLLAPLSAAVGGIGLPPLLGPYFLACVAMIGSSLAAAAVPHDHRMTDGASEFAFRSLDSIRVPREVLVPLAAMVAANFTMVGVMTMTPVHIHLHGQGLEMIGGVISVHMLGMFALSPISGRLSDRLGGMTTIWLGVGMLLASTVWLATAPPTDAVWLSMGVFGLGYGWNLCWIGGSSVLSRDVAGSLQAQVQGDTDAIVWSTSAVSSLVSGWLLATGGFMLVASVGGAVALLPLLPLALVRRRAERVSAVSG